MRVERVIEEITGNETLQMLDTDAASEMHTGDPTEVV
jgi:hypothetical protein